MSAILDAWNALVASDATYRSALANVASAQDAGLPEPARTTYIAGFQTTLTAAQAALETCLSTFTAL